MNTPFNVRTESWTRLSALLDEAYELDAAARAALIEKISAEDAELGNELARLLAPMRMADTPPAIASDVLFTSLLNDAFTTDALRDAPDNAGLVFGGWTLTEKIGLGGMGEVWRAVRSDGMFQGTAAIKLLRSDLPADKLAARFARERAVLARLNHPNIARLLDAGVANDQAFIVLELVQGEPLLPFAAAHAPTLASRVRLIRDIARAVEHAHSQLVLHRDLKPSNVLVTIDGTVKLLDFGIAAALDETAVADTSPNLTQLTGRGLTLEYAAPEQILGEPTVAASDVYSLGAMLFHLSTGQRPFAAKTNRAALEYAVVHDEAPRASSTLVNPSDAATKADEITPPSDVKALNGDLDAIIAKTLRKSAAERYATTTAFASDLDAWLTKTPISIRTEERSYRLRLWLRRNWALATLGTVAAASVLVGLGVSLWQRSEAVAAATRAQDEAARANKVADYLGELIQSANPDKHGGAWPSVLTLLEKSEKEVDKQFKDDPKTLAILLRRLADANLALHRNTVALAQLEALVKLLKSDASSDPAYLLEAQRLRGDMLIRLRRGPEALVVSDEILPAVKKQFGQSSQQYAEFLVSRQSILGDAGRFKEATRSLAEGTAILLRLSPDDVRERVNLANSAAILYTKRGMFRDALAALAVHEKDFPLAAKQNAPAPRDLLIIRHTLEQIRLRLGLYDGIEARLDSIVVDARALLGANNKLASNAQSLLNTLACETAQFAKCLTQARELAMALKRQPGVTPIDTVIADLERLSIELQAGQKPEPPARAQIDAILKTIEKSMPVPSAYRSVLYRMTTDVAVFSGRLDLADSALKSAQSDLIKGNVKQPERIANVERAAAQLAYARGDAKRAVELLGSRFRLMGEAAEGDTPRHATLWLQKALYELEFDPVAARASLQTSRTMFGRAGAASPHFQALLNYIDARVGSDPARVRAAEDAVDSAYLRSRKSPWLPPFFPSL